MIDTPFVPAIALLTMTSVTFAEVITVDDNGPADFGTIQEAVDFASDGDEIVVAPGRYYLGKTIKGELPGQVIDIQSKSVRLRSSHGPEVTVIDGSHARRCIRCFWIPTQGTEIIGFTFRNGHRDSSGGGAISTYDCTISVTNCIFENNHASSGGALEAFNSDIDINACSFHDNSAQSLGGAISSLFSTTEVWHCEFDGNASTFGGAVSAGSGSLVTGDCAFTNNIVSGSWTHGGAIISSDSDLTVHDCFFSRNLAVPTQSSSYAGAIAIVRADTETTATVDRSVFIGNEALMGGAIWNHDSGDTTISNCAFIANHAFNSGGGLMTTNEGTCMVDSCSFKMNTAGFGSAMATIPDPLTYNEVIGTLFCENEEPAINGEWSDLGANVFSEECQRSPDLTCDGVVDGQDLSILLSQWGQCEQLLEPCIADLDGDGLVDGGDLTILLADWTNQP